MESEKLTVAVIGYGARGKVYTKFMYELGNMTVVAVCEKDEKKLSVAKEKFNLSGDCLFTDESVFFEKKRADVALIATPDRAHYAHAVKALNLGYDLLLEKPISPVEKECREICASAARLNRKVMVCHVLRYTPFYQKVKQLIQSGIMGSPVTINQTENVGYWHQAHSFVRGNWRNKEESSPMILQKCCHDLDIIKWLIDKPCKTVSSFGSLSYFNKEHAPVGSADYCYKCAKESQCPFDCVKFYCEKPDWLSMTGGYYGDYSDGEAIRKYLSDEKNPYARCVFQCDNDVVDHQVVNMEFSGGETACLTMTAFSKDFRRTIKIHLTNGEIVGDIAENKIEYTVFGQKTVVIDVTALATDLTNHCGGDKLLVKDFYYYITGNQTGKGLTSIENSLDSHLMAFAAEQSRMGGGKAIKIKR